MLGYICVSAWLLGPWAPRQDPGTCWINRSTWPIGLRNEHLEKELWQGYLCELVHQGGRPLLMSVATYPRKGSHKMWSMLVCSTGTASRSQNSFLATIFSMWRVWESFYSGLKDSVSSLYLLISFFRGKKADLENLNKFLPQKQTLWTNTILGVFS